MNFKFFREEDNIYLSPTQFLSLRPQRFTNNEFCFQFDDEEPQVFATGNETCTFQITPGPDGSLIFNNNGRTFKIFAREAQ